MCVILNWFRFSHSDMIRYGTCLSFKKNQTNLCCGWSSSRQQGLSFSMSNHNWQRSKKTGRKLLDIFFFCFKLIIFSLLRKKGAMKKILNWSGQQFLVLVSSLMFDDKNLFKKRRRIKNQIFFCPEILGSVLIIIIWTCLGEGRITHNTHTHNRYIDSSFDIIVIIF